MQQFTTICMTFDDFGTCLDLMNDNVFVELGILVPKNCQNWFPRVSPYDLRLEKSTCMGQLCSLQQGIGRVLLPLVPSLLWLFFKPTLKIMWFRLRQKLSRWIGFHFKSFEPVLLFKNSVPQIEAKCFTVEKKIGGKTHKSLSLYDPTTPTLSIGMSSFPTKISKAKA